MFAIANCFSILTGKVCSCFLEEMKLTQDRQKVEVVTALHDPLANDMTASIENAEQVKHYIDDNTAFKNLWYSINGCSRYYLNNDIKKSWKLQKYNDSYFKLEKIGKPRSITFFGFHKITYWPLNYKSCLILPIRFVGNKKPPSSNLLEADYSNNKDWNFWGFICIYCNSRNVFNDRYAPELGGAFADLLYIYLSQLKMLKSK
jgi:hypothetical protein